MLKPLLLADSDRQRSSSPARVAAPYKFDLFGHYVEIIASMDNEKQRIVWLDFAAEKVIGG
jgi:hypothetical protein